ncbi:MAG: hypothetical protein AAFV87_04175 [Pseudomonadota bacterium]
MRRRIPAQLMRRATVLTNDRGNPFAGYDPALKTGGHGLRRPTDVEDGIPGAELTFQDD